MVDTGAVNSPPTPGPGPGRPSERKHRKKPPDRDKKPPEPRRKADNPVIQVTGAASPIQEQPEDYINADAVFSSGGGAVESYHYDRQPTYREQYAAESAQVQTVSGPGQGGQR